MSHHPGAPRLTPHPGHRPAVITQHGLIAPVGPAVDSRCPTLPAAGTHATGDQVTLHPDHTAVAEAR